MRPLARRYIKSSLVTFMFIVFNFGVQFAVFYFRANRDTYLGDNVSPMVVLILSSTLITTQIMVGSGISTTHQFSDSLASQPIATKTSDMNMRVISSYRTYSVYFVQVSP